MQYRLFIILTLVAACLCATATAAQTFKRKPKTKPATQKTATAKQATVAKPVETLPEEEANTNPDRITTHALKRLLDAKADIVILDNRTGSAWIGRQVKIKGAIHVTLQGDVARVADPPGQTVQRQRDHHLLRLTGRSDERRGGVHSQRKRLSQGQSVVGRIR